MKKPGLTAGLFVCDFDVADEARIAHDAPIASFWLPRAIMHSIPERSAVYLAAASVALLAASVANAAPPAQLKDKSIVINWSETRQQRDEKPDGTWTPVRSVSATHKLSIYVSTAGRVFSRQINATDAGSGTTEQVAGERGGSYPVRTPSFSAQTMTIIGEARGGARRTVVDFDASFTSCSARASTAFEGGQSSRSISPITKRKVEIVSVSAGSASCSMQSGNVMGGPS